MAGSQDRLSLSTMKLQLTLQSASDIQGVDLLSDTKVYAVAWIEGGSRPEKQNTQAKEGYSNPRCNDGDPEWSDVDVKWNDADPEWNDVDVKWKEADAKWNDVDFKWNEVMSFVVDEEELRQGILRLKLELRTEETETTSGKIVGDVSTHIKFLANRRMNFGCAEFFSYRVRNPSGKFTGKINLTMQLFGTKKGKKRKKEALLTTRTPFTPPTIESPCSPPEVASPCSSPSYSPEPFSPCSNPPCSPEGASPCSSSPHSPFTTPDYLRHAAYSNPNPTFPPLLDYSPWNTCYPHAPFTAYSQAAAPLVPQVPCLGQYLARVGEYPSLQAWTQKKKRKETKMERKKRRREMKEWKKKMLERQKEVVPLNFCTELALPHPHYSLQVQYPSSQHWPTSLGYPHPSFTQFPTPNYPQHAEYPSSQHYPPSSGYPHPPFTQCTRPFYPQQAAYLNPNSTFPQQNYPQQAAYPNLNPTFPRPDYPQQAAYPNPNPTFPRPDHPQQAAYPNLNPTFPRPDYPQQAVYPNPNPTFPRPDYPQQAAYPNPNPTLPRPDYPQQAAYPNPNPTFPRPDHPEEAAYPIPNPTFHRPDYPQQAVYPNPNFNPNPIFPPPDCHQQAAYPNPNNNTNPTLSPYAGHGRQYLASGEQNPLQQAYPQQGGHTVYSGRPYDQGGNIPYTVVSPTQQLGSRQRT